MIPPKESEDSCSGNMWKLVKSLYGLRSAPKAWWETLTDVLKQLGFTQCKYDRAMFVLRTESSEGVRIHGIIHIHVDDLLFAGDEAFESKWTQLKEKIKFGDEKAGSFTHLGIELIQDIDKGKVSLKQTKKIDWVVVHSKTDGNSLGWSKINRYFFF